ncbi:MAG: hypothetical protein K2N56_03515 [Oscillospiraceae bacterium]|nr:hypothetical protein [Oscillospiraceae bacterium]
MKKPIKATALLLAFTMTLTACSGGNGTRSLEEDYKVYLNAAVTEVEDKPFTLNGTKGTYSGDWKGNRPEGEGTFWINDDEYYYSENWSNGDISGQGEIRRLGSDGIVRLYVGECAFGIPSGQGTMEIGESGDEHRTVIDGDFNDPSQLLYYTLDENDWCIDVGRYINGEYESYVGNFNVTGSAYLIDRQLTGGATYKSRNGNYIGQVNEKGQPNGYGYYTEEYELNPGIIEQLTSCTYHAVGSWKNGKLEGYFSDVLIGKGTITEYETGFFGNRKETKYSVINSTKREGNAKNDRLVGNYMISTSISSNPPRPIHDNMLVTRMNFDTNEKIVEQFNYDDTHTYQYSHMVSETVADEGEFLKYDKDGNVTIHRTLSNGKWTELKNLERESREEEEARLRMFNRGAAIALFGLTFAGACYLNYSAMKDFDNSDAGKFLADVRANCAQQAEDRDKYHELKKKADDALKTGHYNDASMLYDEAEKYLYAVSWW